MSERFEVIFYGDVINCVKDEKGKEYNLHETITILNEQQELIEELHTSDNMGWERAEKFEKELKQKNIYIKRLEYKMQKFKEMNDEQQAEIERLQKIIDLTSYQLKVQDRILKEVGE